MDGTGSKGVDKTENLGKLLSVALQQGSISKRLELSFPTQKNPRIMSHT